MPSVLHQSPRGGSLLVTTAPPPPPPPPLGGGGGGSVTQNGGMPAQGENVVVEVELRDGAGFEVIGLGPEPGFGFITLRPRPDEDEPSEVIVPLASIAQIRLHAVEEKPTFGFQLPG